MNAPIFLSTTKRRLREKGLIGCIVVKKPLLRPANRLNRLNFVKEHKDWTIAEGQNVLWSDESKFELLGTSRRQYVRRNNNERFSPNCIAPTVKHGEGSVMVWGCFNYERTGSLVKIDGIMKKEQYHNILERHAIPSGTQLIGRGFIFQQDNDRKHTSHLCSNYLQRKEDEGVLQKMEWPPQSPDINPIELLWDKLDRRAEDLRPISLSGLRNGLNQAWDNITAQQLQKLVKRLPKVCSAVIKAKGGHFDEKRLS